MNRVLDKTLCVAVLFLVAFLLLGDPAGADSQLSDQKMERFLLKAEVTRIHMVVSASTNPMAVDLERKGETRRAAFKYGLGERPDPGNTEYAGADKPSMDSYKHEVAAYRLDRALDMHMVPVAVIRNVKTEGALVEWISDASTLQELEDRGEYPADGKVLDQQMAAAHLFDALILNVNRKENELLVTPSDWKLHLIDHSRGFRTATNLPESFLAQPAGLSKSTLKNLEKLDKESMEILLGEFLSAAQIDAMLARRDQILKKIQADRELYGDDEVLRD
jgi:hypothetical protein